MTIDILSTACSQEMQKIYVHLISDSTGNTLSVVARTVMAQFDHIKIKQYLWALIKTENHMERVLRVIEKRPGIVMCTITDLENLEKARAFCKIKNIPCIEVLKHTVLEVGNYLKKDPSPGAGRQHVTDDDYYKKIEAINFTIAHDDGQYSDNLSSADIILVGPSRTSKSPTSIYLAHKGFKSANVPYISGTKFICDTKDWKNIFVVGLSISPERLVEIRKNRLLSLNEKHQTSYVDMAQVENEMLEARRFCMRNNWPVIDITNKSVEEISARIIQMYYSWRKK